MVISAELSAEAVNKTSCETAGWRFTDVLGVSYWVVTMDILKMLADLRAEREQIEQAIVAIERLAVGTRGKRRGRPPAWMSKAC